jgi:hypothetical protein
MIDSDLSRTISRFRQLYEANVANGSTEPRLSELPKRQRDNLLKRDGELHPSSFPFCGLRHAYERFTREDDPIVHQNFGSDYFLSAGHVFHAALQKWLGRSGKMLGNWYCPKCKHLHKHQATPEACVKCKCPDLEYQELGGTWGKHVHWHSDGVFKTKDLWVVDYKSTSVHAIEKHFKTKSVFPYVRNRFQIESYVPLLEDLLETKIAGWLLVYAARDNPNHMYKTVVVGGQVDAERREVLRDRLVQADKDFGVALQVKEKPVRVFKRLKETKLCDSRDFYNDFIHDQYDPCPLSKVCFGSKLQPFLQKAIDG